MKGVAPSAKDILDDLTILHSVVDSVEVTLYLDVSFVIKNARQAFKKPYE